MADLICRRFVLLVICAVVLGTLFSAFQAYAQSEGLELKQSPNGKRALRLHGEKRTELVAQFHASNAQPLKRYEQACERHLHRYTSLLEREMRVLTRKGSLQEAEAVQSAMKRTDGWAITPPDSKGVHFLTKEVLEVQGSDKVTKLGVDLQVNVEKAAALYNKQSQVVFDQYETKVAAARQALLDEMVKIQEQEQRSGRLEAVQEIQNAIAALKKLPEVARPAIVKQQADETDEDEWGKEPPALMGDKIPDDLMGFYAFYYDCAGRTSRETLIELRKDGGLVRGEYFKPLNMKDAKWTQEQTPVEVTFINDREMRWRFTEYSGREITINMQYSVNRGVVSINGTPVARYRSDNNGRDKPKNHRLYKQGYVTKLHEHFSEGDYIIDLDLRRDPDGERIKGKMKFLLEFTSNSLFISASTSLKNPDKFEPCRPTLFMLNSKGEDIVWYAVNGLGWDRKEHFAMRTLEDGTKEVRLWWEAANYHKGHAPDASGTLTKQED